MPPGLRGHCPEEMPLSGRCGRERAAGASDEAAERPRCVQERLEVAALGLGELEKLRRRQEALVRAALEQEPRREAQLSPQDKLLELRRQLSCLRMKDASLIAHLQELDQQINQLQLDDQLEMDSRPSSGFFELSDGASGSLSNSSHSVFSECFCLAADPDGHFPSTEELESCLDNEVLVGGLHEDSSSGAVQHSASAPHPLPTDAGPPLVSDSKHHRNLLNKGCYQNPLTTMVVQSPIFLKTLCGSPGRTEAGVEGLKPQSSSSPDSVSIPVGPQSSSWRFLSSSCSPQTLSQKHVDSYIYSLLQRRAHPIRTSRPRTSISTDPSKSSLWHPGPSLRQASGSSRAPGVKRSGSAEGMPVGTMASPSNQRQGFMKGTSEVQDVPAGTDWIQTGLKTGLSSEFSSPGDPATNRDSNASTNRRSKRPEPIVPLLKDFKEQGRAAASPHPKDPPCYPTDPDLLLKSIPEAKTSSKRSPNVIQSGSTGKEERSSLETTSQIPKGRRRRERGRMVNGRFYSTKQLSVKVHKANSKKSTRVKSSTENKEPPLERKTDKSHYNSSSKKSKPLEDRGSAHMKVSRSGASSGRDTSLLPEGHVQSKPTKLTGVQSGSSKLHHHGNHSTNHRHHGYDQVVIPKPKIKRHDYRRRHATVEIPQEGTHKCSWQQQKKELMRIVNKDSPSGGQQTGPYVYVAGSDSEYSAECLSLFHSTVVDTSEDEKSNYTANCFGDCESSEEEEVEESSTTEESLEGVAGGVGRRGLQVRVRKAKQEVIQGQTKTFVKVKASYHLKKKILRSRSGSLRLMTTV